MTLSSQTRSSPIARASFAARHVAAAVLGTVLLSSLGIGFGLIGASPAHAEEEDNLTVEIIDPNA
ncbi:MAG: hypothetical protein KKF42_03510, partial [Actinobacteria bacterium]|nr:hypothetical protein [Actinomycetota bacterium]